MKTILSALALSLAIAPVAVSAQTEVAAASATAAATPAFPLKSGVLLRTTEGRRVGVVDTVAVGRDGKPHSAQLIFNSKIIRVPVSTISANDRDHFTTSLNYAQVKAL